MPTEHHRAQVQAAVQSWLAGDGGAIFRLLDENVVWTVIGSTPVSRTYSSRRDFVDNALKPLSALLDGAIEPRIVNVLADGDHVVLQWDGHGRMKSGRPYANRYCWVMRFAQDKIIEGTAYLDTALVDALFE
ncbi:MAG: nuclear transport factor 2 family protein [Gammaproteobacteria bacterium]|nr:nuclear transport factor 2 family protein [Gammaproteobacteria bacterium]